MSLVVRRVFPKVAGTTTKAFTFRASSVRSKIIIENGPSAVASEEENDSDRDEICKIYCDRLQCMLNDFQEMDTKPSKDQYTIMLEMVLRLSSRFPKKASAEESIEESIIALQKATAAQRRELDAIVEGKSFIAYQSCIASLIDHYGLESTMHFSRLDLAYLRMAADGSDYYFFLEDDTKEYCNYMTHQAMHLLKNMDAGCAQRFRKKYRETFITEIVNQFKYYDFSQVTTDPREIRRSDQFWRDVNHLQTRSEKNKNKKV